MISMKIQPKVLSISMILSSVITGLAVWVIMALGSQPETTYALGFEQSEAPRDIAPVQAVQDPKIRAILDNLLTPSGAVNQRAVSTLKAMGPDILPGILNQFNGSATKRQEALLSIIAGFQTPATASHLMDTLSTSPSTEMAVSIGHALVIPDEPALRSRLSVLARSSDPVIRLGAAIAMRSGPKGAFTGELLLMITHDNFSDIRQEALISMTDAPAAFREKALTLALTDKSAKVRLAAVRIIREKQLPRFLDPLESLLRQESSQKIRKAAAQAIVTIKKANPPK